MLVKANIFYDSLILFINIRALILCEKVFSFVPSSICKSPPILNY